MPKRFDFRYLGWHRSADEDVSNPELAPTITAGPTIQGQAETTTTIRWDVSRPCTGQIEYGTTSAYGSTTTLETRYLFFHIQTITGLTVSTLYHYRVISVAEDGQTVVSSDDTFTTPTPTPSGPTISSVAIGSVTQTSVAVSWSVSPDATGQVEYGLTTAYGQATTETVPAATHSHPISGLSPGTVYFYRITSVILSTGGSSTSTGQFQTQQPSGGGSSGGLGSGGHLVYGMGVWTTGRGNLQIRETSGGQLQAMAYRWTARFASAIDYLGWIARVGAGYSLGDGGTIRFRIFATNASGNPTGAALATETWDPDADPEWPWNEGKCRQITFSPTYTPAVGERLCIWVDNTAADAINNFVSTNHAYVAGSSNTGVAPARNMPLYLDSELGILRTTNGGSTWSRLSNHIGGFDIAYANGEHDGVCYIGQNINQSAAATDSRRGYFGGSTRLRERFTPTAPQVVTGLFAVLSHQTSAGTGTVTLQLKQGATVLNTVTVPASQITVNWDGTNTSTIAKGSWCGLLFGASRTLNVGVEYTIEIASSAGGYYCPPALRVDATGLGSFEFLSEPFPEFRDLGSEFSTNSGSSWSTALGSFPLDLPTYFSL